MRNKVKWFFPKLYTVLMISTAIIASSIFSITIASVFHATRETQTTINTNSRLNTGFQPTVECQLVETHTVQYIDNPATEVKYIERTARVPVELRNFSDFEELKQWLKEVNTSNILYFEGPDAQADCDDFASRLQQKALEDGYFLSLQIIKSKEYNTLFNSRLPTNALHAINLAVVENNAYYIEPQTNEIVFAAHLD